MAAVCVNYGEFVTEEYIHNTNKVATFQTDQQD